MQVEMPRALEEEALRERTTPEDNMSDLEGAEIPIKDLPPLPEPKRWEQCGESCIGTVVVLLLIGLFVGLTQGVAVGADPLGAEWLALVLIYLEAVIALFCLCGLLCGDPGVVQRTPDTCYPIPPEVLARLRFGQSLGGIGNVQADGQTYCTRCLVWRPADSSHSRFEGSSECGRARLERVRNCRCGCASGRVSLSWLNEAGPAAGER